MTKQKNRQHLYYTRHRLIIKNKKISSELSKFKSIRTNESMYGRTQFIQLVDLCVKIVETYLSNKGKRQCTFDPHKLLCRRGIE